MERPGWKKALTGAEPLVYNDTCPKRIESCIWRGVAQLG